MSSASLILTPLQQTLEPTFTIDFWPSMPYQGHERAKETSVWADCWVCSVFEFCPPPSLSIPSFRNSLPCCFIKRRWSFFPFSPGHHQRRGSLLEKPFAKENHDLSALLTKLLLGRKVNEDLHVSGKGPRRSTHLWLWASADHIKENVAYNRNQPHTGTNHMVSA